MSFTEREEILHRNETKNSMRLSPYSVARVLKVLAARDTFNGKINATDFFYERSPTIQILCSLF